MVAVQWLLDPLVTALVKLAVDIMDIWLGSVWTETMAFFRCVYLQYVAQ